MARRELKMKMGAIVTIQAGFKMFYARKELQKRKKEVNVYFPSGLSGFA